MTFSGPLCCLWLVDNAALLDYNDVTFSCEGGMFMRKPYLDNLRWTTGVLVVLYHVFYIYNAQGVAGGFRPIAGLEIQWFDVFLYAVYPWFMPLLFIVSGICARLYLERHTAREFLASRTNKLLVPSTLGLLAFQFLQGLVNLSLNDAYLDIAALPVPAKFLIVVTGGIGVLWFIQMLWVFSMLLIPLRRLEKGRLWQMGGRMNVAGLLCMTAAVWASMQVLNTPLITVYRFGLYGLVFLLGYFVFSHDEVIEKLKVCFWPMLAAALGLGAAFCVVYFGQNYADAPVNRSPLYAAFGWVTCLAALGGMARYGNVENNFTRWMSKRSFGLYVFHYLGISSVALLLAKPGGLSPVLIYLFSVVAGFGGGYLLNAVISKIPVYRWLVLGIRKEKQHV